MGNSCEQVIHSRYIQLGLQPKAGQRLAGPPASRDRRAGHPQSGRYEGSMTSYGVCGHLLDSLSAWDHSDTLLKPEQARSGRFMGLCFFGRIRRASDGRKASQGSANQNVAGSTHLAIGNIQDTTVPQARQRMCHAYPFPYHDPRSVERQLACAVYLTGEKAEKSNPS